MLIQLLLSHHLKEEYHSTAYAINVYVLSGPQAIRLTRLSREAIEGGSGSRLECSFLKKTSRKVTGSTKRKQSDKQTNLSAYLEKSESPECLSPIPMGKSKKKRPQSFGEFDDDFIVEDEDVSHTPLEHSPHDHSNNGLRSKLRRRSSNYHDGDSAWTFTMDDDDDDDVVPAAKRRRTVHSGPGSDDEVVVLSD